MGPLGFPEMLIIFVVALIVFGPRKLPELGRSLGKGLSEFKRASHELRSTLDDEIRLEDHRTANTAAVVPPPAPPVVTENPDGTEAADVPAHGVESPDGDTVPRSHTTV